MHQTDWRHEQLSEKHRHARHSIADALDVLRKEADFGEPDRAQIDVKCLRLPSGETVGIVGVRFEAPWKKTSYIVLLRTAARFKGRDLHTSRYKEFDIIRLNGAVVDFAGTVTLADKTVLYAVEVLSAPMMTEPSDLDWRIVHAALPMIKGSDHCYRSIRDGLPPDQADKIPNQRYLDCGKLSELTEIPPLKDIVAGIGRADPNLKVSDQKVADALRKFGIRVPSPRPRKARRKPAQV